MRFVRVGLLLAATALAGCAANRHPNPPAKHLEPLPPVERLPIVAAKVGGLERRAGLLDLYLDAQRGRVLLALPPPSAPDGRVGEYLYVEGLVTGLGSNPVGLDRGEQSEAEVVRLRRVGGRLLIEAENLRFRALSNDPAETRAVAESFATSVLWSGEVIAQDADGRALVDLTSFLVRDAHRVGAALAAGGQGAFAFDPARSAVDLAGCLAFPDNVELQSIVTFGGSTPGALVAAHAPRADAVTFVQRQSLLRLPAAGYLPREWDPREGSYPVLFTDYAVPIAASLDRRWIVRHRLQKIDPAAERSPVVEPIVYYVDRGIPEPIRSAVVEGASWWAPAFEAAGFENAYRVELLPEGADPLDARYNVIQWVHRSTRGWAYGGGTVDPRTGEMVRGHVALDSQRIRHDLLLYEGLLGTSKLGSGEPNDPQEVALSRIRQLVAHEVGHCLGFAHNFAASTYGRASVMDYPAPLVRFNDQGLPDLSRAYAGGLGEWDLHAVRFAYGQWGPSVDEKAQLAVITQEALDRGMLFLSDEDARPAGAAQPRAALWDNGAEPIAELERVLRARHAALGRFGERNLPEGAPMARLEEVLAPLYFYPRFEVQAVAKLVGGVDYRHTVRGDGQPKPRVVAAAEQRRALEALLATLAPRELDLPEAVLQQLEPASLRAVPGRPELVSTTTAPVFDALGAAATAADLTLQALLAPERCARLIDFHRRDAEQPALEEVLGRLVEASFGEAGVLEPREAELRRVVQRTVVARLVALSASAETPIAVRIRIDHVLAELLQRLDRLEPIDAAEKIHFAGLTSEIGRYLARPAPPLAPASVPLPPPPGDPIGAPPLGLYGCSWDPGP